MTRSLRSRGLAALVLLPLVLSSCASTSERMRENPKGVLGSVIGAGAGAGIAALAGGGAGWIVAGALAGGLLGGAIGHRLDERDKRMATEAAHNAFEHNRTGTASTWQNPDSGNSGTVTPTETFQTASGQYCRRYTQDIMIGNEKHQTHGTACRQPDGSWQVQS